MGFVKSARGNSGSNRGRGGRSYSANFYPLAYYQCRVHGHLARDCPQAGAAPQGSGNAVPSQCKFSQSGPKGRRGRGRGRSIRFGGLNVLYDEARNEYPVDDAGQLYVPLGYEPVVTEEVIEEKKYKRNKKLKRSCTRVVSDGTTPCSAGARLFKEKKNLREFCEYLRTNRIDRTQILQRVGDVLVIDTEALELLKEEEAGQRSQKGSVMGYCSCGAAYPPRVKRGGARDARRMKRRADRGRSRDNRTISCALARALNPLQGGSTRGIQRCPASCSYCNNLLLLGLKRVNKSGRKRIMRCMLGYHTQPIE